MILAILSLLVIIGAIFIISNSPDEVVDWSDVVDRAMSLITKQSGMINHLMKQNEEITNESNRSVYVYIYPNTNSHGNINHLPFKTKCIRYVVPSVKEAQVEGS